MILWTRPLAWGGGGYYILYYYSSYYYYVIIMITSSTESRWRLCFHSCLSLFVCLWAGCLKKSFGRIQTQFGEQVRCVTRMKWLTFDEDLETRIFEVIIHHWPCGQKRYIARYRKMLWTKLDDTLWTDWVCVKDELNRYWWRSGSGSRYYNFFKWFFIIEDGAKNDT